jgi:hypothetical protein
MYTVHLQRGHKKTVAPQPEVLSGPQSSKRPARIREVRAWAERGKKTLQKSTKPTQKNEFKINKNRT